MAPMMIVVFMVRIGIEIGRLSIGKVNWGEITTEVIEDSEYFDNKGMIEGTWV